jgi:hypothetical protein
MSPQAFAAAIRNGGPHFCRARLAAPRILDTR